MTIGVPTTGRVADVVPWDGIIGTGVTVAPCAGIGASVPWLLFPWFGTELIPFLSLGLAFLDSECYLSLYGVVQGAWRKSPIRF